MIGPLDAELFRAELRLADEAPICDEIGKVYLEFKKLRDVIDAGPLTAGEVAFVCLLAGRKSPELDLIEDEEDVTPQPEDRVIVLFRNKRCEATYKGDAKVRGKVIVHLDDEVDTREVAPDKILEVLEPA